MSFHLTGEMKLAQPSVQLPTVFDMAGLEMVFNHGKLHSTDPHIQLSLNSTGDRTFRVTGQFDTSEAIARQYCSQLGLALEADGIGFHLQLMEGDSVLLSIEPHSPVSDE